MYLDDVLYNTYLRAPALVPIAAWCLIVSIRQNVLVCSWSWCLETVSDILLCHLILIPIYTVNIWDGISQIKALEIFQDQNYSLALKSMIYTYSKPNLCITCQNYIISTNFFSPFFPIKVQGIDYLSYIE